MTKALIGQQQINKMLNSQDYFEIIYKNWRKLFTKKIKINSNVISNERGIIEIKVHKTIKINLIELKHQISIFKEIVSYIL